MEAGADVKRPDGKGRTLVAFSVPLGNRELLEALLAKGADPTLSTDPWPSAFSAAGAEGSVEILRLFIEHTEPGSPLHDSLSDALLSASERGKIEAVRFLVSSAGADVNGRVAEHRTTPLSEAVQNGHDDVVQFLVQKGARIEGRTRAANPLLIYAIKHGRNDWVQLFLGNNPAMDAMDLDGKTALMVAAEAGNEQLTRQLLEHGATPGKQNSVGTNALHYAAFMGHTSVVAVLLAAGVSPLTQSKDGTTPRQYAESQGHHDTANLLLKAEQDEAKKRGKK
jgi:uncharacterized protein